MNKKADFAIAIGIFLVLWIGIVISPIRTGDDWETFYGAAQRVLSGESLYGKQITFGYSLDPPWVAAALVSISLLPFRYGISCLEKIWVATRVSLLFSQ